MSWLPLDPSQVLSDVDPLPVDDVAASGTSTETSRDDHVHTLGVLDLIVLTSPDGTLWSVTVTDLGALTTDEVEARITEDGNFRITEDGNLRVLEG